MKGLRPDAIAICRAGTAVPAAGLRLCVLEPARPHSTCQHTLCLMHSTCSGLGKRYMLLACSCVCCSHAAPQSCPCSMLVQKASDVMLPGGQVCASECRSSQKEAKQGD